RSLEAKRDLGLHVGQLLLVELGRCQGPAELLPVKTILTCAEPAVFRSAHHAPRNAITRPIETAKRSLQARNMRKKRLLSHFDTIHHDFTGDGCAQRQLAMDLRRGQA